MSSLSIRLKLNAALEATKTTQRPEGVTKNALAREAKVRPNLIYELCEGETKRIDLATLSTIIKTLNDLSGKKHTVSDILEYIED